MERRQLDNKWTSEQWEAIAVAPSPAAAAQASLEAVLVGERPGGKAWRYDGLRLQLFADEAENYLLNVTAPEPRVFVMWRQDEGALVPRPVIVTASYGEAARMLDAGEQVDGVPMPAELRSWVEAYARLHYRPPEPGKGARRAATPRGERDGWRAGNREGTHRGH